MTIRIIPESEMGRRDKKKTSTTKKETVQPKESKEIPIEEEFPNVKFIPVEHINKGLICKGEEWKYGHASLKCHKITLFGIGNEKFCKDHCREYLRENYTNEVLKFIIVKPSVILQKYGLER